MSTCPANQANSTKQSIPPDQIGKDGCLMSMSWSIVRRCASMPCRVVEAAPRAIAPYMRAEDTAMMTMNVFISDPF